MTFGGVGVVLCPGPGTARTENGDIAKGWFSLAQPRFLGLREMGWRWPPRSPLRGSHGCHFRPSRPRSPTTPIGNHPN